MQFNPFPNIRGVFLGRTPSPEEKSWVEKSLQVKQVHGDVCLRIQEDALKNTLREQEADALVTVLPGRPLAIRTADCVPILFGHPQGLIGAVHAGWRGTVAGILEKTFEEISRQGDWDPRQFRLAIGPAICGSCYEVGAEVAEQFEKRSMGSFLRLSKNPGKLLLDLKAANQSVALKLGIPLEQIEISPVCTLEEEGRYYSHRGAIARGEPKVGRNFSIIELIPARPR